MNCEMHMLLRTKLRYSKVYLHYSTTVTCLTRIWWIWWLPVRISISPPLRSIRSWRTTTKDQVIHIQWKPIPQTLCKKRNLAEAVLTEVQGQEALDCKELGYMVPWEHQDLVVQEVHVGQEQHHGVHGEQVVPMDLLDPVTKVAHRWK